MDEPRQLLTSQANERIAKRCVCCGSDDLKRSPAIMMPFVAYRAFGWQDVEITPEWGLRSVKNGHAYALCNSVQCSNCGFLFLDIRFNDSEMASLYNGYRTEAYAQMRETFEPGYLATNDYINAGVTYVAQIEEFLSPYVSLPVRILDWGGDTGQNAPFPNARSLLHVYDISNRPVVEDAELVSKSTVVSTEYDLIVCANVLEHIPFPAEVVLEIKKSMHKDTVLYIEVPRERIFDDAETSVELYKLKKHWHEHINFYSAKSLRELVTRCGMDIIEAKELEVADGYHPVYHVVACKLA